MQLRAFFGGWSLGELKAAWRERELRHNRDDVAILTRLVNERVAAGGPLAVSLLVPPARAQAVAALAEQAFPGFVVEVDTRIRMTARVIVREPTPT